MVERERVMAGAAACGAGEWDPEFLQRVEARREALRQELASLPWPPEAAVLEIGCGHGHYLAAFAAAFPGQFCIGIDLQRGRLEKARRKVKAAGLKNAVFVAAEASEFLAELPDGVRFGRVIVLFPDPWPKRRHHKNRLLRPSFFNDLAGRAATGADLFFRTDHQPYFNEVAEVLAGRADWEIPADQSWPLERETVFQAKAPRHYSLRAVKKSPSKT